MNAQATLGTTMPTVNGLGELAAMVKRSGTLHVRFSPGPDVDDAGPCIDGESGLALPGLSADPLAPPEWWTRPLEDWLARQLSRHAVLCVEGCRPWLLTGTDKGQGPNAEPLLGHVRPVAWIDEATVEEAVQRYRDRFTPEAAR